MTLPAGPDLDLRASVLGAGRAAGLAAVGTCSAEPFVETRRVLEERRDAGLGGTMAFTYRNPARSTDPSCTLAEVRTLVVAAHRYPSTVPDRPASPSARVARYATADHYGRLRAGLDAMAVTLRAAGHRAMVLADDNGLVDRAAAYRAALGWYGRSANLLLPGAGSWFVLGSVLTTADLGPSADPVPDGCGTCRRCVDGCPTGAIVADGVVDARRCLAWHLQMSGEFPREFRAALGDRLYGCDECQEVCPPNRRAHGSGAGLADEGAPTPDPGAWVDLHWMLRCADDDLLEHLGRWYVPDRDPRMLRRNALVILGNVGDPTDPEVEELLVRWLDGPDDLLAGHAAWAALRMGRSDLLAAAHRAARAVVAAEVADPPPTRQDARP